MEGDDLILHLHDGILVVTPRNSKNIGSGIGILLQEIDTGAANTQCNTQRFLGRRAQITETEIDIVGSAGTIHKQFTDACSITGGNGFIDRLFCAGQTGTNILAGVDGGGIHYVVTDLGDFITTDGIPGTVEEITFL